MAETAISEEILEVPLRKVFWGTWACGPHHCLQPGDMVIIHFQKTSHPLLGGGAGPSGHLAKIGSTPVYFGQNSNFFSGYRIQSKFF